ncbi:TonB-dependent receptor domain-containing protein [Rubellimicrobium arenae]|uniref:TonB-dependent receptor domain-containing protein n=1 Tax=Rubellimicrobium arenae TaxID=2817372 RepID=UPI001B30ADAE|nr:TonB-dependent receptor [Rubellimicrobium arenae]
MTRSGLPCFHHAAALAALLAPSLALAQEVPVVDLSGESPTFLGSIVVTASGFEQNVAEAPASVSVVPNEAIANEQFNDLTDALRGVQGVVTTGVANEDDIYIRGLPGEYTLILVDGRRQGTRESRTNGSSGYEQSFIPPAGAIERIEVVRGPMSSLYGSDAIGGVINIITKPVPETWGGEVSASVDLPEADEFGDEQQLGFYAGGPLLADRLGLQVWGRRLDRDGSSVTGAENEADEADLTGRLTWRAAPDHTLYAEAGRTSVEDQSPDALSRRENDRDHVALGYDGTLGGWTFDADLQRERGERTSFDRLSSDLAYTESLRSPEIENTVLDVRATRSLGFGGLHRMTVGAQRIDSVLTDQNPGTGIEDDQEFSISQDALFVEDEWQIAPSFSLTAGVRLNRHEEYDDNLTPRLYGVWSATPNLTIKGGVSTGFKAPDIREIAPGYLYTTGGQGCVLDPTAPQPCGVIVGDPDLVAETSTNYELGVLYGTGRLSLGATWFQNEIRDKIANARVYNPDGSFAVYPDDPRYTLFYHYNIGEARIRGAEMTADWQATDRLSLRATYTYTNSEQLNGDYAGFPLARTPEHLASLRLDYRTPVEGLDLWGLASYHGEEINAGLRVGENGDPVTDADGRIVGRKYGAYTTVDLGATYAVSEAVTLNAAVYNVLDETIEETEFGTTREGRSLWLGATARF